MSFDGIWKIYGATWTPTHWCVLPDPIALVGSEVEQPDVLLTVDEIAEARIQLISKKYTEGLTREEEQRLCGLDTLLEEKVSRVSQAMWNQFDESRKQLRARVEEKK